MTPDVPSRPTGNLYMGGYAAPPMERVRFGIIGMGERGCPHMRMLLAIEGAEIAAICDLRQENAEEAAQEVFDKTGKRPATYCEGIEDYLRMLREVELDAVIINTPWKWHAPMAIDAMEHGVHAFVEVPLATTLEELWRIVDCAERTQRHCMMMENVNYGREELMYLNMVRQGVIGELLHGEAAYIHEMRDQMKNEDRNTGAWRTMQYAERNGNLYPTHGLGPVAQYMSLARTEDTFARLVSFSSPALGRAAYARENFPADHQWNRLRYCCGDINTSIIKTRLGRTILLQWDETSPRPYTRLNLIQGTKGALADFPPRMAGEFMRPFRDRCVAEPPPPELIYHPCEETYYGWTSGKEGLAAVYERYEHPLYRRMGAFAATMDHRGGMSFLMLYRIVECLRRGEPLDQNVYEGAFWSAVGPLSEQSVAEGGMPQSFPDFTRGDWRTTAPLGIVG